MRSASKSAPKRFQASLERGDRRLGWTIARIPFDVAKVWGSRGRLRVRGSINGFAFRTSLFPTRAGGHFLLVNKKMQKGGKASLGAAARFEMEPDTEPRVAELPDELLRVFEEDHDLRAWYSKLSNYMRYEIGRWIKDPKSPETRARRADQMAERLLATMEAEIELPPMIRLAFSRDPRAWEGWNRMSPTHRRQHLMAFFHYRTPDSQARRLAKTIEACRQLADKQR